MSEEEADAVQAVWDYQAKRRREQERIEDEERRRALPAQPKEGEAATRSADTDGDAVQGLHLASLDGAPGDAGADLTDERSAE